MKDADFNVRFQNIPRATQGRLKVSVDSPSLVGEQAGEGTGM